MKNNILLALAFAALSATSVHADDAYMERKLSQDIYPGLHNLDFTIHASRLTPPLDDGEVHTFTINPDRGDRVALVAIGDWDSNDVDLFVQRAGSDSIVDSDVETDDMPVCEFVARGGTYIVTVKVVDTDCAALVRLVYATK